MFEITSDDLVKKLGIGKDVENVMWNNVDEDNIDDICGPMPDDPELEDEYFECRKYYGEGKVYSALEETFQDIFEDYGLEIERIDGTDKYKIKGDWNKASHKMRELLGCHGFGDQGLNYEEFKDIHSTNDEEELVKKNLQIMKLGTRSCASLNPKSLFFEKL